MVRHLYSLQNKGCTLNIFHRIVREGCGFCSFGSRRKSYAILESNLEYESKILPWKLELIKEILSSSYLPGIPPVPRLAAAASPGNSLEMQPIGPHPRLTESQTLEMGPGNLCFGKPSLWFCSTLKFEKHCLI